MAGSAVVRVKRRCEEEPVDSLVLVCKKIKIANENGSHHETETAEPVKRVFKFAGTVANQGLRVASANQSPWQIRSSAKCLRKHRPTTSADRVAYRQKNTASNARFKIVSQKRSFDSEDTNELLPDGADNPHFAPSGQPDKMWCVFDVEKVDDDSTALSDLLKKKDVVACNDVPLVRERVGVVPSEHEDGYVYDFYHIDDVTDFDFRALENILGVEAFSEQDGELWWEDDDESEDEAAYDEDDENAENNWRNDYPDDDPMYFERLQLDDEYSDEDDDVGRLYDRVASDNDGNKDLDDEES